jgi:addiction module RelE/StbE family toxin
MSHEKTMEIRHAKGFKKALARLRPWQVDAVEEAVSIFRDNRSDPSLHDHALKGKMKGLRSFTTGFDLRVIYREHGGFITIILLDVGTHNQVY